MKEQMKGWNRIQMNVGLQMIAAADGDGSSVVGLRGIAVIRDGIRDIERLVDGGREISGARLAGGDSMQRVPGLRGRGDEIGASVEMRELVATLIVRHRDAKFDDAAHADLTIFTVKRNRGLANWLSQFVENLAGKHGRRVETQHQVFGIETGAGHDCG